MYDCIDLGSAPAMEACAQVGSEDYVLCAHRECRVYIAQIRRTLGEEPEGARLAIKENPHDFGTCLSVVCYYRETLPLSLDYALKCESQGPHYWDEQALRDLAQERR